MLWSCKPIRSVSSDGGSTEGCSSVFCAWFIFQFSLRPRQLCKAKKTRPNLGKGNVLLCWCAGGFPVRDKSDLVPASHSSRWDLRTSAHEGLWEIPAMKVNYKPLINQTFTVGWSGLAVWAGKSLINTAGSWQQGSGVTLKATAGLPWRVGCTGWVLEVLQDQGWASGWGERVVPSVPSLVQSASGLHRLPRGEQETTFSGRTGCKREVENWGFIIPYT